MTVMNEFCCDTSKIFCCNSLLSALTFFKFALNIHPTVMNLAQKGEKKRSLAPKRLEVSWLKISS